MTKENFYKIQCSKFLKRKMGTLGNFWGIFKGGIVMPLVSWACPKIFVSNRVKHQIYGDFQKSLFAAISMRVGLPHQLRNPSAKSQPKFSISVSEAAPNRDFMGANSFSNIIISSSQKDLEFPWCFWCHKITIYLLIFNFHYIFEW